MFKSQNFCHIASNNRNNVKVGVFVYRTTDNLETVTTSGYFNDRIVDINLHDLIIHEQVDNADQTKVKRNVLCVTERTLENVGTRVIKSDWEEDIEEDIEDLQTYVDDTFVRKDGTSVMTGPLKFRAGSFEGAIAGGLGDGISVYKLKADGSIDSEVASLTKTNGFVPGTNNAMDVGRNNLKWKDAYIARVITAVLNNGSDLSVPNPGQADTIALKSQVDLAANSGSQLYTTGVWYAKMYAATTVPTGSEYDGRNYADFSQVDNDNNPIIVIYTCASGAWTETTRITPPATYNGYITVTSKIWDIAEQSGQQGGQVLWSYNSKTFTPYPRIVSFESINVTGDSTVVMPGTPTNNSIVNKQYVDDAIAANPQANISLSNLNSTGKNISNWSTNVSNCITEIPQDINIELSSGSLIVKAGTKAYMPDGTTVTVASDITVTASSTTDRFLFLNNTGTAVDYIGISYCYSGASAPTVSGTARWFDTANNVFKQTTDSGSTWTTLNTTLPIAIFHTTSGSIDKVEVFNGFGYIGSTIFALPGVKILIPQGRNADGTLKNKAHTVSSIMYYTYTGTGTYSNYAFVVSETGLTTYTVAYNPETNYVYRTDTGATYTDRIIAGNVNIESGRITYFKAKQAFHAVDYSDSMTQIQNVDSSRVGYVYNVVTDHTNIYAPAGGTWLVLASFSVAFDTGIMVHQSAVVLKCAGEFVAGGTQIQAADNREQHVVLLKVA